MSRSNPSPRAGALGDTAAELAEHLRTRAADYFPDLGPGPVAVRLERAEARPYSGLLELAVENGARRRRVLVKLAPGGSTPGARPRRPSPSAADRPRLVPPPAPALAWLFEHGALCRIEEHFLGLGDPRFDVIRVIGLLPDARGFMMERVDEPSLRALLLPRVAARGRGDVPLDAALRNAGAWLRSFHGMRRLEPIAMRHGRPAELIEFVREVTRYLGRVLDRRVWMARLAATLRAEAEAVLPDPLPLGLAHGDFAPRNLLIGPGGRVTVCDTRARWRTAVYEDLGYFLTSLRYGWARLYTGGLALPRGTVERLEADFLAGYFGEVAVPQRAIRIYELLALLDRTAWIVSERERAPTRLRRIRRAAQVALLTRAVADLAARPIAGTAGRDAAALLHPVPR